MFGRTPAITFIKTNKPSKNDGETPEQVQIDLEAIQDFIVNTVAGVATTVVAAKVVMTICDLAKIAAKAKLY